jgi:DNA repair protein RadA/Sms
MPRTRVRYRCEECGFESPQWLGRCTDCGGWGTFGEAPLAAAPATRSGAQPAAPVPIAEVDPGGAPRRPTGVAELDRVLRGGLVAGSVTLVGGEPGMGKSTLLLQALGAMAGAGARCLLVSAEESPAQVRLRADRLGALAADLLLVHETSLPAVCAHTEALAPDVVAVDSIQTVYDPDAPGAAGSVAQVRDGAQRLVRLAKETGIATIVVGHVTKDGALAGPRALEHVVDTVLSFEGDRHHSLRMLRALKHRFGSTEEMGLLEMRADGLQSVSDPSALFLADRRDGSTGSVVAPVLEGARPLCVEVQSLVVDTNAPNPRRVAQAVDHNRLALLLAVLQRRAGLAIGADDVYVSVAGGARVVEPGADLAVVLAVASAKRDRPVGDDVVALGEVGLGGEVRQVPQAARRLTEAARLGFRRAIVPRTTPRVNGLECLAVDTVADAMARAGLSR